MIKSSAFVTLKIAYLSRYYPKPYRAPHISQLRSGIIRARECRKPLKKFVASTNHVMRCVGSDNGVENTHRLARVHLAVVGREEPPARGGDIAHSCEAQMNMYTLINYNRIIMAQNRTNYRQS